MVFKCHLRETNCNFVFRNLQVTLLVNHTNNNTINNSFDGQRSLFSQLENAVVDLLGLCILLCGGVAEPPSSPRNIRLLWQYVNNNWTFSQDAWSS